MIDFIAIPEERIRILRKDEKWREHLKKFVDVQVELNEGIGLSGEDAIQVIRVKEVFKAFGRGFDFDVALNLLDEEYMLDIIDIQSYVGKSRSRQITLKGRIIGTRGKMKRMIEKHAEVKIAVYGKTISIIGKWNNIRIAREAIEMLLTGSMHNTVYRFLEKNKP